MRKVILGLGMSLDGYIARPNGDIDFLLHPQDYSMADFFATVGAGIMSRKTLDDGLRMNGGKLPKTSMKMYVMSRTQPAGEHDGVIYVNEPPAALVERIRRQSAKNIWMMGGGQLAREFLKDDLIDELYLGIVPVLIGEGIPIFPGGFPQREFTLTESKAYSQGLVALKYERTRAGGASAAEKLPRAKAKPAKKKLQR